MRDFNFFSPYLKEKRNKQLKKIYIITVSSLVVLSLITFTVLNLRQISRYNKEISKAETYISQDETINLLHEYENAKKKTELTKLYMEKAIQADTAIRNTATVNTALLDKLNSVMPEGAFLISLSVNGSLLEMQYSVNSLVTAAEIEHNLKNLGIFEKVHIGIIDSKTNETVSISCMLKEVSNK